MNGPRSDDDQSRTAKVVAHLCVAGRYYRFFVSGQLMNANAGRSMRKVFGPANLDSQHSNAADEDEQGDHHVLDNHIARVALPSVSRLKWDAVVKAEAFPFDDCARLMKSYRSAVGRRVQTLAKQLPVWEWAASIRGGGALNLGLIVGEIGNLSHYSNPAKVWKRMGLAVLADGGADRRLKGEQTGYSPVRRTLMHNLGECLLKQNDGIYRAAYDTRKAYEIARDPEIKPIAAHKRALRYMEKLWLRDLWREWRRVTAIGAMLSANSLPEPVADQMQPEAASALEPIAPMLLAADSSRDGGA